MIDRTYGHLAKGAEASAKGKPSRLRRIVWPDRLGHRPHNG